MLGDVRKTYKKIKFPFFTNSKALFSQDVSLTKLLTELVTLNKIFDAKHDLRAVIVTRQSNKNYNFFFNNSKKIIKRKK